MRILALIISLVGISLLFSLYFLLPPKPISDTLIDNQKVIIEGKIVKITEVKAKGNYLISINNLSVYYQGEGISQFLNKEVTIIAHMEKYENNLKLSAQKIKPM